MNEAPNRVHVSRRDSVESGNDHSYRRIIIAAKTLFWLALAFILIQQLWASWWPDLARARVLSRLQNERKSRVIAMIHRQETVNFLGVPVSSYLNIEDSEEVLRAIRLTPDEQPIDMILHTPGGLVLAAEQIAKALVEHKGKVTVFVPHYAMSGGNTHRASCRPDRHGQQCCSGSHRPRGGRHARSIDYQGFNA